MINKNVIHMGWKAPSELREDISKCFGHDMLRISSIDGRGTLNRAQLLSSGSDNMLSERLVHLRAERQFTQDYIADYLGLKRQTYGAYERRVSSPDADTLIKLAKLFEVSTDYLLGLSDIPSGNAEDTAAEKLGLSAEVVDTLQSWCQITELLAIRLIKAFKTMR